MTYNSTEKMGTDVVIDGLHFESITEGQWYSYFQEMGMDPQPQPNSFLLDGGAIYTPDFFLPAQDTYVEVKNNNLDLEAFNKCRSLAVATRKAVLLTNGAPKNPKAGVFLIGTSPTDTSENISSGVFRMGTLHEASFFRGRYPYSTKVDPKLKQATIDNRKAMNNDALLSAFDGLGELDFSKISDGIFSKFLTEE